MNSLLNRFKSSIKKMICKSVTSKTILMNMLPWKTQTEPFKNNLKYCYSDFYNDKFFKPLKDFIRLLLENLVLSF